jgi:hypothetical protein
MWQRSLSTESFLWGHFRGERAADSGFEVASQAGDRIGRQWISGPSTLGLLAGQGRRVNDWSERCSR